VCSTLAAVRRGFIFHTSRLVRLTTLYTCMQRSHIFVQNRVFCLPQLHSTPPLGGFPSKYRHPVWHGKTRMAWLRDSEKNSKISLFVLAQFTNVPDGRTDTHTDRHRMTPQAALMHRIARQKYVLWNASICPITEILWKSCFPMQNFYWNWRFND